MEQGASCQKGAGGRRPRKGLSMMHWVGGGSVEEAVPVLIFWRQNRPLLVRFESYFNVEASKWEGVNRE